MTRRFLIACVMGIFALGFALANTASAQSAGKLYKLALQISDDNPQKMDTVLNVAANTTRYYTSRGEQVDIQIVAFNKGLHMFREDTSPKKIQKRLTVFSQSMPNVGFRGCGVTLAGMTKKEGKRPPIMKLAQIVPAGVVRLMELSAAGYTIIRP